MPFNVQEERSFCHMNRPPLPYKQASLTLMHTWRLSFEAVWASTLDTKRPPAPPDLWGVRDCNVSVSHETAVQFSFFGKFRTGRAIFFRQPLNSLSVRFVLGKLPVRIGLFCHINRPLLPYKQASFDTYAYLTFVLWSIAPRCQKRPIDMAKEAYAYTCIPDVCPLKYCAQGLALHWLRANEACWYGKKEAYWYGKRGLLIW